MKKVTDFLEQHVQWVALGLGAVYLLWMVYGYILTPSITAQVSNRAVNLGNVDEAIAGSDGPVKRLEQAMSDPTPATFATRSFVDRFQDEMNTGRDKYASMDLGSDWTSSQTQKVEVKAAPGAPGTVP